MSDTILVGQKPTVDLVSIMDACNEITFTPSATYSAQSRIDAVKWTFPSEASPVSSTAFSPGSVMIKKTGRYVAKVEVTNALCINSRIKYSRSTS